MSMTTLAAFGVGSALLDLAAIVPYIRSIRSGKTKPERSTWWIWSILMVIALAAQAAAGATWSLLLTGTLLIGNLTIAALSVRSGYGHFKAKDLVALLVTALGAVLWKATNNPLAALIVIIAVDFLGNWLTLTKSWRAPYSENLFSWALMALAGVAGLLAVGSWHLTPIIFPLYLIFANSLEAGAIAGRRSWRKQRVASGRRAARTRNQA